MENQNQLQVLQVEYENFIKCYDSFKTLLKEYCSVEDFSEIYSNLMFYDECVINNKISFVYFIKNNKNGLIKIGATDNIKKRFKTLKNEIRNEEESNLQIIGLIPVVSKLKLKLETIWHKEFCSKRIYKEWFKLDNKDLDLVFCNCIIIKDIMFDICGEDFSVKEKIISKNKYDRDLSITPTVNQVFDKFDFNELIGSLYDNTVLNLYKLCLFYKFNLEYYSVSKEQKVKINKVNDHAYKMTWDLFKELYNDNEIIIDDFTKLENYLIKYSNGIYY